MSASQAAEERPDVAGHLIGDVVVVVPGTPGDGFVLGAAVVEGAVVERGGRRLSAAILFQPEVAAVFATGDLDDLVGRSMLHHDGNLSAVVAALRAAAGHWGISSKPIRMLAGDGVGEEAAHAEARDEDLRLIDAVALAKIAHDLLQELEVLCKIG